jgi:hypothetical protein
VEALDMPILHRPAGLDVNQPDLPVLGPAQHRREVNSGPLSERRIWCPYLVSMSEFRHLPSGPVLGLISTNPLKS